MCANWLTARLLQIGATVNIPMVQEIYTDLDADPKVDLLELFTTYDIDVDKIRIRKTIYFPSPFM